MDEPTSNPETEAAPPIKPYRGKGRPITKRRKGGAYQEPVVDEARVLELARLGPAADGHAYVPYERQSPPMPEAVKKWFDALETIHQPATPSAVLFWEDDRVVYIARSAYGLFSEGIPSHFHGASARNGVEPKRFDRISLLPIKEELLDAGVRALVRLLKPKYHRAIKRSHLEQEDISVLRAIGYTSIEGL